MAADDSDRLLDRLDRCRDPSAFGRAATLSATLAQMQLRHLAVTRTAPSDFQRLAGMLIRADARLRAPHATIAAGAGPQSAL